jgi:hypothetical protein
LIQEQQVVQEELHYALHLPLIGVDLDFLDHPLVVSYYLC